MPAVSERAGTLFSATQGVAGRRRSGLHERQAFFMIFLSARSSPSIVASASTS